VSVEPPACRSTVVAHAEAKIAATQPSADTFAGLPSVALRADACTAEVYDGARRKA
jgi:hypothetical protein